MSTAPIDIVPPEEEGPPAPDVTDSLPSVPGAVEASKTPAPDDTAWPPPVPQEALQGQQSAAPVAPKDLPEDVIRRAGALEGQKAQVNADLARQKADRLVMQQADLQEALDKGNSVLEQRQKQYDDALANYQGKRMHDYWDTQPTSARARAAIAIAFGGLGRGMSGRNEALDRIQKRIDQDTERQKEDIQNAKDSVVMARTGLKDAAEAKAALTQDVYAKRAAALETMEAEARAKLADFGVPAAAIDTDQRIVQLRQHRQDAERKAAEERQKEALVAAQTHYYEARSNVAAKKAKGGGSGGAAGSGLSELVKMKEEGASDSDIAARAAQLRIPPGGKNGYLASIKDVRATAKEARQGEGAEVKQADEWAKQNGLTKIATEQRELGGLMKVLTDNASNPLAQALAVEKAVSAARGGAASRQALDLALHHLGGGLDNAEGVIQKWRDGQLGDAQKKNFLNFLNGQISRSAAEGKEAYDNFDKYVETQPEEKRKGLTNQRGRLFSGLAGFGGKVGGGSQLPKGIPSGSVLTPRTAGGKPVYKAPDGTLHVPD